MPTVSHARLDRMTEQVTEDDDLWIGECSTCSQRYQIFDIDLVIAYPQLLLQLDEVDTFLASCTCGQDVELARQIVEVKPFSSWTVLPPASGCIECGVEHEPDLPHDWQTLVYQYGFRSREAKAGRPERWPTIRDAMAHCEPEMQQLWIDALAERGVSVD